MKLRRPRSVTFLAFGVLTITGFYWTRLVQVVNLWDFLSDLPLSISPQYLAVSGLVFGLAGLPIVWGLWSGKPWAPRATRLFLVSVAAMEWYDRLWLADPIAGRVNLPFALGATFGVLMIVFRILSRPIVQAFIWNSTEHHHLGEVNDQL